MSLTPRIDGIDAKAVKNYIVNGGFDFWQRGDSVFIDAIKKYTADRWLETATTTINSTYEKVADVPSDSLSKYSLKKTNNASMLGVSDYSYIEHRLEGNFVKDLYGKKIKLNFWVKSSIAGEYAILFSGSNPINDRYVTAYTINLANTWELKSITIPLDTTPNIASYNKENQIGFRISWQLYAGSSLTPAPKDTWTTVNFISDSAVNWGATNGATFQLSDVMLYEDTGQDIDVPFQRAGRNYAEELQLCQRYYYKHSSQTLTKSPRSLILQGNGTNGLRADIHVPVNMRATPIFNIADYGSLFDAVRLSDGAVLALDLLSPSFSCFAMNNGFAYIIISVTSGVVPNQSYWLSLNADGYMEFDAEI
jgi:hypothetical protein